MRLTNILLEANVRNVADIDHYLEKFARQIRNGPATVREPVYAFLTNNVKRWIINNEDVLQLTQHVADNEADWAKKAHAEGKLFDFIGSPELDERLQHVMDGVKEIAVDQPQLLNRFPTLPLDGVENLIADFYQRRMGGEVVALGDGEEAILDYPDGARWVQLTSPEALAAEGRGMGHCVGGDYYARTLAQGDVFYSYRDSKNRPHITIHARIERLRDNQHMRMVTAKKPSQVKGRQNQPPIHKYVPRLLDFLNKFDFNGNCSDLERLDIIRNRGVWKVFDPMADEELETFNVDCGEGEVCTLYFKQGFSYIKTPEDNVIKLTTRNMSYDPDVPLPVYKFILANEGGSFNHTFDRSILFENIDHLEAITKGLADMEPRAKWRYKKIKGVEFVVRGNRPDMRPFYFIKDGEKVFDTSTQGNAVADGNGGWTYPNKTPMEYLMVLALQFGYPMDPTMRLNILGRMSPAKAAELGKKIKPDGNTASLTFDDPLLKHLPDGLSIQNTLFLKPTCGLKKLPNNMKVRRDLNLRNTQVETIGDNTHVVRNMRLGGSKVKKLPKGLKVGGGTEMKGCLDLRGSLITSVPDDLELIPQRLRDRWHGNNAYYTHSDTRARIIIAPGQKVRIPKHLQQYVEVKKYTPEDTEVEDSYDGTSRA